MTTALAMLGFTDLTGPVAWPSTSPVPPERSNRAGSGRSGRGRPRRPRWPERHPRPVVREVRDRQSNPSAANAVALAAAVRQQLTHPGSVSPQRQLELILADRMTLESDPCIMVRIQEGWTPFLVRTDPCPYRPLADGVWPVSSAS
jgi:hypothetical protein